MGIFVTSPKPSVPLPPQYLTIASLKPPLAHFKAGKINSMPFKGLGNPAGVRHPRSIGAYQLNGQNG